MWSWVIASMAIAGLTQSITGWLFSGNARNPAQRAPGGRWPEAQAAARRT